MADYSFVATGDRTLVANFRPVNVETAFVTSKVLRTLRNDFPGWVGMQVRVGPDPVMVVALGRIVAPGNTGVHRVKFIRASDLTDVPGGAVDVATAGGTVGEFAYASLANPVVLQPGTLYFLVSEEFFGGDRWYDLNTSVTTTSVAQCIGPVFLMGSSLGGAYHVPNTTYGPVDYKYIAPGP
jgi:hypothetical protein